MRALALALWLVAFQEPSARPVTPKGEPPPFPAEPLARSSGDQGLSAEQVLCGALLREGFRTPYLHPEVWRAFQADPAVTYEIKNGVFRVFGVEGKEPNSNRAFSRDIHSDDAVLVCEMRANSLTPTQGRTMYRIHYCGRVPDRYAEMALENYDGALKWRFWANRVGENPKDAPTVVATSPRLGETNRCELRRKEGWRGEEEEGGEKPGRAAVLEARPREERPPPETSPGSPG